MLLCGLVSKIMYKAMWLASGISEAFGYGRLTIE